MPYKDYEFAKARVRARYYERKGLPVPEGLPQAKIKRTKEEMLLGRKHYLETYWQRPEVIQRRRDRELRRCYGITWDDKQKMYANQGGFCGFCGEKLTDVGGSHVDHDHKTGIVRKLVHKQCNSVIAVFEDRPELFDVLKEYLCLTNQ